MAKESGTATGFIDLYQKIITFATTGLGADNWTMVHGFEHSDETVDGTPTLGSQNTRDNKVILRGDGSGSENIYIGLQTYYDSDLSRHNFVIQGLNDYDNTLTYEFQAYKSTECYAYAWDQAMPYWIIGSSRRIIVVFKVGSVYEIMYLGFILPYATPAQYAYPLLVGGTGRDITWRYADSHGGHDFFINGRNGTSSIYGPNNIFMNAGNYDQSGGYNDDAEKSLYFYPYSAGVDNRVRLGYLREALDGCHVLTNIEIVANGEYGFTGILGSLDSMYHVSGFNQYSENIITIDATEYLVVQRVFRTDNAGFVAIKWE